MPGYRLSTKAAADIRALHEYTIEEFGLEQARVYLRGLAQRLEQLAQTPNIGRRVIELAARLRRADYQSHMIFYIVEPDGILIVRVLHQNIDAKRHL
jgi:toxin ParE1/3/4